MSLDIRYFDCNATTPLGDQAKEAWVKASSEAWFNPGGLYRGAVRTRVLLEDARASVATCLGCASDSIVFTSGATESNNAFFQYIQKREGQVLIARTEHASVRQVVQGLFPQRCEWLLLDCNGIVVLDALEERLAGGGYCAVSVMAVNNETGVIQPWEDIQNLCAKHKATFHTDATQWIGKMPSAGMGVCDFVTLSAHKFGGPKGVGLLKVPSGVEFTWLLGGGQEQGRRSGTENYPSVVAMAQALQVAESQIEAMLVERAESRDLFEVAIKRAVPGVSILCEEAPRVWNTTLLLMPRFEGWRWVKKLDALGYAVGLGSACLTGKGAGDSVAAALGVDISAAKRIVRVSAGWGNSRESWLNLAAAFTEAAKLLDAEDRDDSVVNISLL